MNNAAHSLMQVPTVDAVSIAAFIKRHWTAARWTPREVLVSWVRWFMRGDLITVVTERGRIAAVGMARGCFEPEAARDNRFLHVDNATVAWLELVVAKRTEHIATCFQQALQRLPHARTVAFLRRGKTGRLIHKYKTERFKRSLKKGFIYG